MDERRRLCHLVLDVGMSLSQACREVGVSRPTGRLWVQRARQVGLGDLCELSRAPHRRPGETSAEIQSRLLALAEEHPYWGPRKLLALAYPSSNPPLCERTLARILKRAGRRVLPPRQVLPMQRFERLACNELWQMDFKCFGPRRSFVPVLSVLDDASRFCLGLEPRSSQSLEEVQEVLWDLFGAFGLPEAILTDNGPAFRCHATWRWSKLDLWLKLLKVESLHGRPYHPQTQGKVERFHGTLVREGVTPNTLSEFRHRYNWRRPHEALGLGVPGHFYTPSLRHRPPRYPEPEYSSDCHLRRTDANGVFSYKGQVYKAGIAFPNTVVGIQELENGPYLIWAHQPLVPLRDLLRR